MPRTVKFKLNAAAATCWCEIGRFEWQCPSSSIDQLHPKTLVGNGCAAYLSLS